VIDKLIHDLAAGWGLNAEEIMDVLWLSTVRPLAETTPVVTEIPESVSSPLQDGKGVLPPELPGTETRSPMSAWQDSPMSLRLGGESAGSGEQLPASEIGFGSPRPIRDPLALPRALRRLRCRRSRNSPV